MERKVEALTKSKSPQAIEKKLLSLPDLENPLERVDGPTVSRENLPHQAMIEAMDELQEVMVQYTSCADPSESTARKERLRQAKEAGEFE